MMKLHWFFISYLIDWLEWLIQQWSTARIWSAAFFFFRHGSGMHHPAMKLSDCIDCITRQSKLIHGLQIFFQDLTDRIPVSCQTQLSNLLLAGRSQQLTCCFKSRKTNLPQRDFDSIRCLAHLECIMNTLTKLGINTKWSSCCNHGNYYPQLSSVCCNGHAHVVVAYPECSAQDGGRKLGRSEPRCDLLFILWNAIVNTDVDGVHD